MEFSWLRSFSVLAETLHFGRAAAQLNLSQSALSVQIKKLEESLQVQLFLRDRRSVLLTRAGESFRVDARRLLEELAAAQRKVVRSQKGEAGFLRVAFVNSATFGILPPVIRYYKAHIPEVEIHLRNLPTIEQVDALLRNEIDIGFIRLPFASKELEVDLVHSEPFVCFLPKTHPLAALKRVAPARLKEEPFVLYERRQAPGFCDRILKLCLDSGFSPRSQQDASEMQTILSMVASGLGVSILPESAGALGLTELAIRPLEGRWPASETGTAILKAGKNDPLISTFLRVTQGFKALVGRKNKPRGADKETSAPLDKVQNAGRSSYDLRDHTSHRATSE